MLGEFQQSQIRIEVRASGQHIAKALTHFSQLRQWLTPQYFGPGLPATLTQGLVFKTTIGPVTIAHQVDFLADNAVRLLLSQAVDGFHEWYWGEGWVQSRLEGISPLPLNFAHTINLWRLRSFLESRTVGLHSRQ